MPLDRKVDLNDSFRVDSGPRRKVDRERIYAAWVTLHEQQNKSIPPLRSPEYAAYITQIRIKAETLAKQNKILAGAGHIYFATLLILRNSIDSDYTDLIVANKATLRHLETMFTEEELTPKL